MVKIVELLKKYKIYFVELFVLAMPMIIGNLGQIFIGITNVYVAAKYSIDALAAIAIANAIIFTVFIVGMGFLMSISITLSNYRGSKAATKKYFNISILYTLALSVLFTVITFSIIPLIDKFGFEAKLVPYIKEYMFISAFSFVGIYLYQGIREFLLAHEIVFFPNIVLLGAVFVNFVCNFVFVFGFGPIPAMGVVGLALSTLMVRTLMGIVVLVYCLKIVYSKKQVYKFQYIKKLFKIGAPIGITLLVEFLAFNLITVLAGRIDGILAATHNIILNIADASFMIPLALSSAMAIKIGYYNGAKNYIEIKRYSLVGLSVSMIFMFCTSLILLFFPREIIGIFTDNKEIMQIGVPIVFVAAVFQIFDGLQVAASGVLKGLKLTKIVSQSVFSGYWLLGIPLGCVLAYKYNYELLGFWIGLAFSLFIISIILSVIIVIKFKQLRKEYS